MSEMNREEIINEKTKEYLKFKESDIGNKYIKQRENVIGKEYDFGDYMYDFYSENFSF